MDIKVIVMIGAAIMAAAVGKLAHEVGTYCAEVNPYGPEDYPRADEGAISEGVTEP